jgi:ABC-type antimicrobial peptide transport system permease subunit
MLLSYAFKHVFRSWKIFVALLIGIALASTFFAGIDIKANVTAKQALDQELDEISMDITASIHTENTTRILQAREEISSVEGVVDSEIISSFWELVQFPDENESMYYTRIVGIAGNSHVYDGWLNRPDEIGENETYIWEGSPLANMIKQGDVIQLNFSVYVPNEMSPVAIPINLSVKGFAQLDDKAYSIASGYYSQVRPLLVTPQPVVREEGLLIVDWNSTARRILDTCYELNSSAEPMGTTILVYIDRDSLITPWDIVTSIGNIETIELQITNKLAELGLSFSVDNNLQWALMSFQFSSIIIRFAFTLVSLPIFFMAWYMGTTVSDVSFNLRRREVGLLSTKGFSRRQLLATFVTETLLIGIIGGALGVLFGFLLNPLFTQLSAEAFFNPQVISPYTVVFTVAFGVIIAFLSTFSSARKAAKLNTVDALREYLPVETEKPYRKRWPWVALILGTYKIAVFISGLNMSMELTRIAFGAGNFILILLIGFWLIIDQILNYVGPLLFFWGFMKIFVQGSLKFQELTAKAARFFGDLSVLATRNVRRNPARSAAIAFLIALIVGYGVQVTGQLASEQDYTVRSVHYQVGSDVVIYVPSADEATNISDTVMVTVSEKVQNATIEYSFSAYLTGLGYVEVKAVQPYSWLETAYYEKEWFSGNDVATAFNGLVADKDTIILERSIAKQLRLEIGGTVTLDFGTNRKTFEVVGFFGPEPSESQSSVEPLEISQGFGQYWSFIPEELYKEISKEVSASAKILLKLKSNAEGKSVAENIRNLNLDISSVTSFAEAWDEAQSNVVAMGVLDVQRLGIVFAVLAASVGTALVSAVSMKERSREAAIMSVKGLSYKQLAIVFLTENFALVLFSVVLGLAVGVIVVHGNISATNASATSIIHRRFVLPLDAALMLASCVALIFISTILPISIMLRKYVTKLERVVRLR